MVDKIFSGKSKQYEDEYMEKRNREALARLAERKKLQKAPRLSPITGEPMVEEVMHGVVIDRCPKSGGVWLDKGELELLFERMVKDSSNRS